MIVSSVHIKPPKVKGHAYVDFFFFFFVERRPVGGQLGVHRDPNAIAVCGAIFSNTCQKMRGGKHVKVKKGWRQDILRFRVDAQKLILGSIGTPLDHLSVKGLDAAAVRTDSV